MGHMYDKKGDHKVLIPEFHDFYDNYSAGLTFALCCAKVNFPWIANSKAYLASLAYRWKNGRTEECKDDGC